MDKRDKIIKGLERAFQKLIEFKKYKNSPIIVSRQGEIVEILPENATPITYTIQSNGK